MSAISLRISDKEKTLIDHAAKVLGKSRSAFILEGAMRKADEVLLDRTRFALTPEQWDRMAALMDAPPTSEQRQGLQRLLSAPTPWKS